MQSIHNVGLNVADSIKQNILQGKYIQLQTLLPPSGGYGGNVGHKTLDLNNMGEIMAKDTTKKFDSIEKWTVAMHIFASIFLAFHPNKAAELIKYIHIVRLGAARGSVIWYDYGVQYRLRKAMNPSTSWGKWIQNCGSHTCPQGSLNHQQSPQGQSVLTIITRACAQKPNASICTCALDVGVHPPN